MPFKAIEISMTQNLKNGYYLFELRTVAHLTPKKARFLPQSKMHTERNPTFLLIRFTSLNDATFMIDDPNTYSGREHPFGISLWRRKSARHISALS